jgi:hypothetical protein
MSNWIDHANLDDSDDVIDGKDLEIFLDTWL